MLQARRVLLLAKKDLQLFIGDRGALLFALAFPLVFVFAFSLLFSQQAAEDAPIDLVLVTQESEPSVSTSIIQGIAGDEALHARQLSEAEARAQLDAGDLAGFILFPPGFTEGYLAGNQVNMTVVSDPDADYAARGWLQGFASSLASTISNQQAVAAAAIRVVQEAGAPIDSEAFGEALERFQQSGAATTISPVTFVQAGDVEPVRQTNVQLPGYLTMFVFFVAGFAAAELVRERDNHTLDRLVSSGVTRGTILAGKWTGTVTRGLFQAAVLWTVGVTLFDVDMGRAPLGTVLITVGMVLASASFAILLASFATTERSATSLAILSALVLAPLGGSWWPLFITSPLMQQLAKVTPHAWANDAFNRLLLFGADTPSVLPNVAALLGFTVVLGGAGWLRVRAQD